MMADVIEFNFFDIVWMVIDEEDCIGMGQVIGIMYKPGAVLYQVQWIASIDLHYAQELTKVKPESFTI